MWEWLLQELKKASKEVTTNKHYGIERDDVVSNVILNLYKKPELAIELYESKSDIKPLLICMLKREVYAMKSKYFNSSKGQLSRYNSIIKVCEKYNIDPLPENAYKISVLINLEKNTNTYSIARVINVLSNNSVLSNNITSESIESKEEIFKDKYQIERRNKRG